MNKKDFNMSYESEVVNDLYDLIAKNTDNITQDDFYYKYNVESNDMYLDEDKCTIHFPDFDIVIKFNN